MVKIRVVSRKLLASDGLGFGENPSMQSVPYLGEEGYAKRNWRNTQHKGKVGSGCRPRTLGVRGAG